MRLKILSGFLILAFMLAIAGLWTIYELKSAGFSVQALLDENYRSISAAETMIEALEREDSAVLLFFLGEEKESRYMFAEADSTFNDKLIFAYSNLTIPGEKKILDSINSGYKGYKESWEAIIYNSQKEKNINIYYSEVHANFLKVKQSIRELRNLNNDVLYQTASDLKQRSNRVIMPGLIAIIAAFLFSIIFNYFVNYYMVSPVIRITERIKKFIENRAPYDITIESNDEITSLSESISQLCDVVNSRETIK
jgi:methyl-accepting chemotaxis protein